MDKWGRNYELTVFVEGAPALIVGPPFTLRFDIARSTLSSANRAQLQVFNLGLKNRTLLQKNTQDWGAHIGLVLRAGYGANTPVIFKGNVTTGVSYREGVSFITQLECFDGGTAFSTGRTNFTFPSGTPTVQILRTLTSTLPNVTPGVVGDYPGVLTRAASYSGATVDILRELSGGGFFIDTERAHVLNTDEYLSGYTGIVTIDASTGLLGTPELEKTLVRFDMIFEPRLQVGQKITLNSLTGANYNGDYKVTAVEHRGVISDAVSGTLVTTGEFIYFKALKGVAL